MASKKNIKRYTFFYNKISTPKKFVVKADFRNISERMQFRWKPVQDVQFIIFSRKTTLSGGKTKKHLLDFLFL